LLRVLTDLYVQASTHSADEARQFVELTSRLIDEVDDATRAAVRARLAIYPATPVEIMLKLGLRPAPADRPAPVREEVPSTPLAASPAKPLAEAQTRTSSHLAMQPADAAQICEMFFGANGSERAAILHSLADAPLKASPKIPEARAMRAIETLEMAAFAADVDNFTLELGEALILPSRIAAQVVNDPTGEPLACAAKALNMPGAAFQRVLMFLNPELGASVPYVFRLSRLYDRLSERSALVMLAAWRGSTMAVARARYRPGLYDDERHRARGSSAQTRPAVQPGSAPTVRTGSQGSES
jgi:hypothetical protein